MTYCHIYETWRKAQYYFSEFVKENEKCLVKASRINLMTLDKVGNKHYFMTFDKYERWCLGRTYMLGDKMYHSDMEIRGGE